jgi:hypothetical protein
LCEVSRLEPPLEANRNPTWFSPDKAKRRLTKGRAPAFGAELARIVDRASSRIQRLHSAQSAMHRGADGLRKVRLEAHTNASLYNHLQQAMPGRPLLRAPLQLGSGNAISSEREAKVTSIECIPKNTRLQTRAVPGKNRN